jgi:hypothetical protein
VISTRGEIEKKIQPDWTTQFGFDNSYSNAQVITRIPKVNNEGGVTDPIGTSETVDLNVKAKTNEIGLFWKNELLFNNWTFTPGLRLDQIRATQESYLNPRLELKNKFNEGLELKAAWGRYVQSPEPQESSQEFGNPKLKAPQAEHSTIGFEQDFRGGSSEGWRWNASLFNRYFTKLVNPSSDFVMRDGILVAENFSNKGSGKAYGLESLVRYESKDWTGWIGYTYSKSTRVNPPASERVFEYDQTHSLNLIGSKEFSNNWSVSGRYRFTTGSPYTPVVDAVLDSDSDTYVPIRGGIYSKRYKNFSQLDLRFDKKWIQDEEIWSLYIDIQNVLNTINSENIQYSYDYKKTAPVSGLPVIPTLGLKGEF